MSPIWVLGYTTGWGEVEEARRQYEKALRNFISQHEYNSDVGSSHSVFFFIYNNIAPLMLLYFRNKYSADIFKATIFNGRSLDIILNKEGYLKQLWKYRIELNKFVLAKLADEDKSRFELFKFYMTIMIMVLEHDLKK